MKRLLVSLAAVAALGTAQAGRNCEAQVPDVATVQRAMDLAERTARALDASGARVVVLARNGQDLARWGLRWSHLGWAYKDEQGSRPVWRVVHKLNACGSATGAIYRQGLGEFFLDDLHEYVAGFAVPTPELQARLLPVLRNDSRATALHTSAYSMVAYPWSTTYQQSNQWAIETLALAQDERVSNRPQAQAWLQLQGYRPSTLHIGALTRLGARMSAGNVAFDDHPNEKRFADRIETVTVDSVFAWLERSALAGRLQTVR